MTSSEDTSEYQNYVHRIEQKWSEEEQKRFNNFSVQHQAEFKAFTSGDELAYQQFVKEVKAKWNQFLEPTRTRHVEYSQDKETRVIIQFGDEEDETASQVGDKMTPLKPGTIRFETLVSSDTIDQIETATSKILHQAKSMLEPAKQTSGSFLDGLVQKIDGQKISLDNFTQFFESEIFPKIKIKPKSTLSSNGMEQVKVVADVKMAPDIWRIQAKKYLPLVQQYGQKYSYDQFLGNLVCSL